MGVFRVEKNTNYTVISNYHLRDKNLSLKSIGLLSLILSLPDEWDYSQAGLAAICKDGEDSIRTSLKELEKYGYLIRERERDESGKMKGMIYHIFEVPKNAKKEEKVIKKPKKKKPTLENPTLVSPAFEHPSLDSPKMSEPTLEKSGQIIKDKQNKELSNKDSIHQSILKNQDGFDGLVEYNVIKNTIRKNVKYEFFKRKREKLDDDFENDKISIEEYESEIGAYDINLLEKMIGYIADILVSQSNEPMKIGEDLIDRRVVKEKLMKVDMFAMKNLLHTMNSGLIKNPKKYAISFLYNA